MYKRMALAVLLIAITSVTSAQMLRTGYFVDGNVMRYRLNPALVSIRGHFSLPVLGGIDLNTSSNVGLSNFIYESALNSDQLVTFMHPTVSAEEFLNGLDSNNRIAVDMDFTLFSLAFHAWGGFSSIDLSLRSMTGLSLPYDMFRFMKVSGNGEYNFGDMNLYSRDFADLSIGHTRKITRGITIGARLKFLFGLAYANASFDNMRLQANADRWKIMAHGTADVALGGRFGVSEDNTVDSYQGAAVGIHGFGVGADIGALYEVKGGLLKGLSLSASLNDLGYIVWKEAAHAAIEPSSPYTFDGFDNVAINGDDNTLEEQIDAIGDDLGDFFTLENKGVRSVNDGIGAKLNIGAEYVMPFWRGLSVGVLYTNCFDGIYSYNQAMLALNLSPLSFMDFAFSGRVGTYGTGFGALVNIHFPGLSLFAGTDCFLGKVTPQYIPIGKTNASVSLGVNIALGKAKR